MPAAALLAEHAQYANRVWVDFVYAQEYEERPRRLIGHVLLAERIWFQRLRGEPNLKEVFAVLPREELAAMLKEHEGRYAEALADDPERVVTYRRLNGESLSSKVGEILLHLAIHGAHHRGQLAAHYSLKGVKPPGLDLVAWLWQRP